VSPLSVVGSQFAGNSRVKKWQNLAKNGKKNATSDFRLLAEPHLESKVTSNDLRRSRLKFAKRGFA
jgi:hypothetical protein